jgi:hypothetical protein
MLAPLEQWNCDTCGQTIESARDGYLEWLHGGMDDLFTVHGFHIVHHSPRSPRQPHGNCYRYSDHLNNQDMHLTSFVGADGLGTLLNWLAPALGDDSTRTKARDPEEAVELIRRLHLPHYEEARHYFDVARADGFLADSDPASWFRQQNLLTVIRRYGEGR